MNMCFSAVVATGRHVATVACFGGTSSEDAHDQAKTQKKSKYSFHDQEPPYKLFLFAQNKKDIHRRDPFAYSLSPHEFTAKGGNFSE
jgi:hypothetical protein